MPSNKNASTRFRIIDECFQSKYHLPSTSSNPAYGGVWSIKDLMDKIEDRIDNTISEKTLKNDIQELRIYYGAPIINIRGIGYKYSEEFSITENPLTEQDYKTLNEVVEILKNYQGFKYFEEAETIISKIESNKVQSDYSKIQLDVLPKYTGLKFLNDLKKAIFEKYCLQFSYKTFNNEKLQFIFHPYLLKEFNNRWYVLGYSDTENSFNAKLGLYALDRIFELKKSASKFILPERRILKDYFSEIYGVTNLQGNLVENIMIKVRKYRSNYLKTKPVHHSQKLIKEEEYFDYFSYNIKLNNEIISLFLSFGKDLEILAPQSFRENLKSHLDEMYKNYQD